MALLRSVAIPLLIALAAMALRLYHVTRYPLSGDEAFTAVLAHRGIGAIASATTSGDPHPPLYYAALVAWTSFAGDSELALRLVGVFAGVLLIPLGWWLGRRLVRHGAAAVAMTWLALHPYQIWYAHEARMYLPTALVATLAAACLWRWYERPTVARLAAYVVVASATMYTHYYGVLLVAFQSLFTVGLWVVQRRRGRGRLDVPVRPWLVAQALLAALYLPWVLTARQMIGTYNSLGWAGPLSAIGETFVRYSVGHTWEWSGNVAVGGAVAAVALLGAVALVARTTGSRAGATDVSDSVYGRAAGLYVVGWALAPAAVGFLASLARPMYTPRYLMVSAVAIALLVGAGVVTAWRWHRLGGAVVAAVAVLPGLVALNSLYYEPTYARSGYDQLGSYLLSHGQAGQAIVLAGWTQQDMFWYYYQRKAADPLPSYFFPRSDPIDPARTAGELNELLRQYGGVWYVETDTQRYDPQKVMERNFTARSYKAFERWFLVNRLVYYQSDTSAAESTPIAPAGLGDAVRLAGGSVGPRTVRPGEIIAIELQWQALRRIASNLKVSLLLRDPDGHTIAAVDREPNDGFTRTSTWLARTVVSDRVGLVAPVTALPGEYRLGLKLYDPATGEALRPSAEGRVEGDLLTLGTIAVSGPVAPSVAESIPATRVSADLGSARLIGYDALEGLEVTPGQAVGVRLHVDASSPQPGPVTTEFVGEDGAVVATQTLPLAPSWSSAWWEANRVYAPYVNLTVPARARSGVVTVRLRSTGERPPVRLFTMQVKAPERSFGAPAIEHTVGARLGQVALLAGYDGPASGTLTVRPGDSLRVSLAWQAIGEADVPYKLFVHLVGPDGKIHGQSDSPPLSGKRPTTGWIAGEWLLDPIGVALAADAPAGPYVLRLGLYDERTGQRLPVEGTGRDYVDLVSFTVAR